MKVNRNDFLNILQKMRPATSSKGIVEDLSCFLFQNQMIYAYNDKLCIGHHSPIQLDNVSIPASELIKIIQGMSSDEVTIGTQDGVMLIVGGRMKARLNIIQSKLTELIPDTSNNEWKKVPADFWDGLLLSLFSASKDMSVPFLNAVYVDDSRIISSDNFRISRFQLSSPIGASFLLPLGAAVELQSFSDLTEYSLNDGWVFFRRGAGGDCIFCARLVSADFPNTDQFFDSIPAPDFELPASIRDGILLCDVLSDENQIDKKIDLSFFGGEIICRGEGRKGSVEFSVEASVPDGVEFSVNPVFLSHVLAHSTTASVSDGKLIFSSGEQFIHIMALVE